MTAAETTAPVPNPDEAGAPKPEPDPPRNPRGGGREGLQQAFNIFLNQVNAKGAVFGLGTDGEEWRQTGRLDQETVAAATRKYVPPSPYDEALAGLARDHVVVLEGRPGTGKRSGAIALLREVCAGPLFALSPVASLEALARRKYDAGVGYLVFDRKEEELAADTEFGWHTVRDQVRDAGAWLVVTTADATRGRSESVMRTPWEQPDFTHLCRRWLFADEGDAGGSGGAFDLIEAALPDEYAMTDLVGILARLDAGEDLETALAHVELTSQHDVRRWFDAAEPRTRRQVLEVTTACFLGGVDKRTFESALIRLDELYSAELPPVEETDEVVSATDEVAPQRRHAMTATGSLLTVQRTVVDGAARQVVDFRVPAHRRHALAELWARMDIAFWNAVRGWLDEMVTGDGGPSRWNGDRVIGGLTDLAVVAFDEVSESYLERWSATDPGWMAAVYTIWTMCFDEALAPVALRTAIRWSSGADRMRRWSATAAFSGVLGASYPDEAVNRMWSLITQSRADEPDSCFALAELFALLATETDSGAVVLRTLAKHWARYRKPNADHRTRLLALAAIREVLSVKDRTGRSAVFGFLRRNPRRLPVAATLWAAVIPYLPTRRAVLESLLDGLRDQHRIGHLDPDGARTLGDALAAELPAKEHPRLVHDLEVLQRQRLRAAALRANRGGDVRLEHAVDNLLQALLTPFRT